jgi:hypothetical protein
MEDLIAAEHGGYHVGLTMDRWWSTRCICGQALGARRTSAEAAALHGVHLDLLERARAAAGRLPL